MMLQIQVWLLLAITIFCGVQTYRDFARGEIGFAVVGGICTIAAVVILLMPMPTHAVKIDIPR